MPKLMLIDGNSLVNRAYYGVRPLSAPDGTPTNAVFGFLNILQRLLDDEKPDYLSPKKNNNKQKGTILDTNTRMVSLLLNL